jgi:hypothetical protein
VHPLPVLAPTFYLAPGPAVLLESLQEARVLLIGPLLALLGDRVGLTGLRGEEGELAWRQAGGARRAKRRPTFLKVSPDVV